MKSGFLLKCFLLMNKLIAELCQSEKFSYMIQRFLVGVGQHRFFWLLLFPSYAPSLDWKTHQNEGICKMHVQKSDDITVL